MRYSSQPCMRSLYITKALFVFWNSVSMHILTTCWKQLNLKTSSKRYLENTSTVVSDPYPVWGHIVNINRRTGQGTYHSIKFRTPFAIIFSFSETSLDVLLFYEILSTSLRECLALQNGVFYIILYTFAIHLKDGYLYNYFEGTAATSTVAQQLLLDLGMFFKLSKDLQ